MRFSVPKAQIIIRFIPGITFFLEGAQKFLYPDTLGIGRFIKLGIHNPTFWAPAVGGIEMLFGLFLIFGLLTRYATIPLLAIMVAAFIYTKLPLLLNEGFLPMFHAYRTDFALTLCLIYLLITGAGPYSLDYNPRKRRRYY